jgi:hypothetical protein
VQRAAVSHRSDAGADARAATLSLPAPRRVGGAAEPAPPPSAPPALRATPPQGDTPPFRASPAGAPPSLLPPLPPRAPASPWDSLCSPRSAPTFSDGTRVSLQDAFSPAGAGEPVHVWWDGTVTGRATSGRTDFLGRPVYRVFFDDLEIQYSEADGTRAVHSEEGGPHEIVFISDKMAFDCDSGEELAYRRVRPSSCTGQLLLGAQLVVLP